MEACELKNYAITFAPRLPAPWPQLTYAWVTRGINIFSWQYFPQHDMINLSILLLSSDGLFSLSFASWFINICPKARRALYTPPSREYLLSPWRDWYTMCNCICVRVCLCVCECLRGLCADNLGAFSILFFAFSRFCDNFHKGKTVFPFSFLFAACDLCVQNDLRLQIQNRIKEILFLFSKN